MLRRLRAIIGAPIRFHFFGAFGIILLISFVISSQVSNRHGFADSELHQDVIERWGAPITQPVPSLRWVESGAVFNTLESMPFREQSITVDAGMNYRKRGLIYFSGFDLEFRGEYAVTNDREADIDLVFVFPIDLQRNQVLLSDLAFTVNGEPASLDLGAASDRLTWTGRLAPKDAKTFVIHFKGRGLDSFVYRLDPKLPVRNLRLTMNIRGGENFDYPTGVVPASRITSEGTLTTLEWSYASLESGVPIGAILPSEKAYDEVIATMVRRAWATFLFFFAGLVAVAIHRNRPPRIHESYLFASAYGLFFVLLAYFAAFVPFIAAYLTSLLLVGALLYFYARWTFGEVGARAVVGLTASFLFVPTLAVTLQGYTGLIYTLEIFSGLLALMFFTTRAEFRSFVDRLLSLMSWEVSQHAK